MLSPSPNQAIGSRVAPVADKRHLACSATSACWQLTSSKHVRGSAINLHRPIAAGKFLRGRIKRQGTAVPRARVGALVVNIDGSCHCGAIRYEAQLNPDNVVICHCTDCQTMSGAPYRVNVPVLIEKFVLTGDPKRYTKIGSSGAGVTTTFCDVCGSPIHSWAGDNPDFIYLRLGSARQRAQLPPKRQGFCAAGYAVGIRSRRGRESLRFEQHGAGTPASSIRLIPHLARSGPLDRDKQGSIPAIPQVIGFTAPMTQRS
jgi:hypothetical protein